MSYVAASVIGVAGGAWNENPAVGGAAFAGLYSTRNWAMYSALRTSLAWSGEAPRLNSRTDCSVTLPCSTVPKSSEVTVVVADESSDGTACASTRPESRIALAVVSRSFELTVSVPVLTPTVDVLMPSVCGSATAAAGLLNVPAGAVNPAGAANE